MYILESLRNLNISEGCLNDILNLIIEEFEDMEERASALAPNNKKLQSKAFKFEQKRIENNHRINAEGTPKEKGEKERRYNSIKEIRKMTGLTPYRVDTTSVAHPDATKPDYQHIKKVAREGLKKGVPGTKRNTDIVKRAKRGNDEALYTLGKKLEARKKSK